MKLIPNSQVILSKLFVNFKYGYLTLEESDSFYGKLLLWMGTDLYLGGDWPK